jgi:hypothetical protein
MARREERKWDRAPQREGRRSASMVTVQQRILWLGRILLALVLLTAGVMLGGVATFRIAVGIDPDR